MRYAFSAFFLSLGTQLRSWRVWLMVLLLPAVILAAALLLPAEEIAAPVQVGVCLPGDGGEAFWEKLSDRSDAVTTFLLADEDTIYAKVSTGQWDCGLILPDDFDSRLKKLDTDDLLLLCTGPGSAVYPLVQETAACVVMELISPGIAAAYAEKNGIGAVQLQPLTTEQQVQVHLQTISGQEMALGELAQHTSRKIFHGCIALLLLIWAVFSAMDLGSWFGSDAIKRIGMVRSPAMLLLPRAAALLAPALLSALCGLALLGNMEQAVPGLLAYLFTLGSLALLLSRSNIRAALPCLMPFMVVLALLLSPMVFDVSALFPALAPVCKYLPMSLYLNASAGDHAALLILWLEGALLLLLFLLGSALKKKQRPR